MVACRGVAKHPSVTARALWCILSPMLFLFPRKPYRTLATAALFIIGAPLASTHLAAQWVKYPTAGVPRKTDKKVDMSAPTPRLADGKPDFSGIWTSDGSDTPRPGNLGNLNDAITSRYMVNFGAGMPGGLPYQPWLAALVKERTANLAKDDPHIRCLPDNFLRAYGMPHLLKFIHTPGLFVTLNEMNAGYRQVFTDARPLPEDPTPSWQGYSSAKWSGDTLVIDTIGVRNGSWLDWNGSELTESGKVREEFRRPDYGHIVIQVTVDDPKAYTKPWTVTLKERILVDVELIDEVCLEDEQSLKHMK